MSYRHEWKYLINAPDAALLAMRVRPLMARDKNAGPRGEYHVRSLYFDDCWQSAYWEKEAGILNRRKYRIRLYNCSDGLIRLERKRKHDRYIEKECALLSRGDVERLLEGDYGFLLKSGQNLLREFYFECTSRLLRPRVIVDYERECYAEDDVRIALDRHVRAGFGAFSLFDRALLACEALPADEVILEVKFADRLPGVLRSLLPPGSRELVAASKYTLCCDVAAREHANDRMEGVQWKAR